MKEEKAKGLVRKLFTINELKITLGFRIFAAGHSWPNVLTDGRLWLESDMAAFTLGEAARLPMWDPAEAHGRKGHGGRGGTELQGPGVDRGRRVCAGAGIRGLCGAAGGA